MSGLEKCRRETAGCGIRRTRIELAFGVFRAIILAEVPAMERFIQLGLQNEKMKAAAENLPKPENNPVENEKKLKRLARTAAHKAAKEYSRGRSGLFSK